MGTTTTTTTTNSNNNNDNNNNNNKHSPSSYFELVGIKLGDHNDDDINDDDLPLQYPKLSLYTVTATTAILSTNPTTTQLLHEISHATIPCTSTTLLTIVSNRGRKKMIWL